MKIECHFLQNVAPSCLNRDDSNTPKECTFGGVRRARVSSQCWKRAIRLSWSPNSDEGDIVVTPENRHLLGKRTKYFKGDLLPLLRAKIAEVSSPDREELERLLSPAVDAFLIAYYTGLDKKGTGQTNVLLFVSDMEKQRVAEIIFDLLTKEKSELRSVAVARLKAGVKALEAEETEETGDDAEEEAEAKGKKKPKVPELKKEKVYTDEIALLGKSADIALFGRMLAGNDPMKVDAACQVGHAISTHATDLEMDFFTAVDDLNPRDDVGAGMLGYVGFSSACLYRYALLDTTQLQRNLGGDAALTRQATLAFLTAFCDAEPSARQNSMPAHNRPSLGLFVAREKGVPTSLANAFCKPVPTRTNTPDLVGSSAVALDRYHATMGRVYNAWDGATQAVFHDAEGSSLPSLAPHDTGSQRAAIAKIMAVLGE